MIDGSQAGRGPQPSWRVNRDLGVENDDARRDLRGPKALFHTALRIGDANAAGKFTGRQCAGDSDVRQRLSLMLWGKAHTARSTYTIGIKLSSGEDVFGETERYPFGAIHRAPPTQTHEHVRVDLSGAGGGGDNIGARRVLRDGVEDSRSARPQDGLDPRQEIGLGGNRRPGDHQRPLAAQAVDFGCELRQAAFTEDDAFLWKEREGALDVGCELHAAGPFPNGRGILP